MEKAIIIIKNLETMKTIITSQKEIITVTKKRIKEILDLERVISYYSHLGDDTMANAISMTQREFVNDEGGSKPEAIDHIYNQAKELIEQYLAYKNHIKEAGMYFLEKEKRGKL